MEIKFTRCFLAILISGLVTLTGCEDGNLFGRLSGRGDSGSVSSLLSDAQSAFRDRNYTQALSLYEQILAQDSDNAEALYGAAAAAVGSSGLNFGQLVANILNQGGSVSGLGGYIQSAREGYVASNAASNSILNGVDLNQLDLVIDKALCRLQKIVSGSADGSIPQNDISALLDFGALSLVRAVLRPLQANFFDLINNNGTYEISPGADFNTICGNSANQALIETVGQDIANAYVLFNRAVTVLNLTGNPVIIQVRDDINSAATVLLTPSGTNALPASCLTILNNIGISLATFQSQTGAFQPPTTNC